ncbi:MULTISPECIES: DUF6456 domain-containing protein [unclassified Mesorhizobium]|uniref:DUF6456 domain-containing protein n=1 Tax=unclassified Mesorhizobium TaxID=325217 RepID=UPI000FCC2EA7|nr:MULTISPECIES: DUF6456 domain-containing protein [unclassified Mesorhizobium]TGP20290.1 hypothetical protein EN874_026280 [Mesorhizobium sp. M1D.F.Ca.ET.231.01.1.1]TGP27767.1 hypothetical protein EN877_25570 [Mesorhizobium sp. M1D.F.Ca.ET.234.01.1.1]TGS42117.1 hypothetical protein EN827_24655 [Mesorhizobium sp. M1D.F.Ca.ET.184.01.1.1]TGS59469.1 hypothetical protein EN826_024655 [Mesorhizobium sp. M1D.F.Ca.ET.183.01.1.1]
MPRKASKKPQPSKLPKGEAEQVRIRREIGHDFALKEDRFGRQRLASGTAEARRVYEVSNGGYTSTGGIVRLRNVDPLVGITSLTRQQREAGQRFRDDFERSQREGLQPQSWSERVDGGRVGGGIPDRVLSAGQAHAQAAAALGHWEVAEVVRKICLEGQSVKAIAERSGEGRDVVVKLLKVGLDLLAVHYGMMGRKAG